MRLLREADLSMQQLGRMRREVLRRRDEVARSVRRVRAERSGRATRQTRRRGETLRPAERLAERDVGQKILFDPFSLPLCERITTPTAKSGRFRVLKRPIAEQPDNYQAPSKLRDVVVSGKEDLVRERVSELAEGTGQGLNERALVEVEHSGNVLHHKRPRTQFLNV